MCTTQLLYVSRPGEQVCEEHCLHGLPDPEEPGGQAQDQGHICGTVALRGGSEEFSSNNTSFGKREKENSHNDVT